MTTPVLEFKDVFLETDPETGVFLESLNFSCRPGGLVLVEVGRGLSLSQLPLADAAQGLIFAASGRILFETEDWAEFPPSRADQARGRIGRVFDGSAWISNLNVDKNVTLARRHHTSVDSGEILSEVAALSQRFNLSPPPALRPPGVIANRLRRYEWVRAFLGAPSLIILENPLNGVYTDAMPLLLAAVKEYRDQGTGFLWITSDHRLLNEDSLGADVRFLLDAGGQIMTGKSGST